MYARFVTRENAPERLVCEAELVFEEAPLKGMKLVGFCLWRSIGDEVYVTFPSRAFGTGSERKYFDYLRSIDGKPNVVRDVKNWILYKYQTASTPATSS